jgi:RNA polymerase sigma-70 factor (ECF subfamily)
MTPTAQARRTAPASQRQPTILQWPSSAPDPTSPPPERGSPDQAVLRAACSAEVHESLLRYARSLCRDHYLAEDLVQDVLVRAIERADQFHGSGSVDGWLKAILRTTFLMVVRAKREWPGAVRDSETPSAEEEALDNIERDLVRRCLSRLLSDRDQLLIDLYYGQGLNVRSIARLLGSTECAVKCHLYRLRRRIAAQSPDGLRLESVQAPATCDSA